MNEFLSDDVQTNGDCVDYKIDPNKFKLQQFTNITKYSAFFDHNLPFPIVCDAFQIKSQTYFLLVTNYGDNLFFRTDKKIVGNDQPTTILRAVENAIIDVSKAIFAPIADSVAYVVQNNISFDGSNWYAFESPWDIGTSVVPILEEHAIVKNPYLLSKNIRMCNVRLKENKLQLYRHYQQHCRQITSKYKHLHQSVLHKSDILNNRLKETIDYLMHLKPSNEVQKKNIEQNLQLRRMCEQKVIQHLLEMETLQSQQLSDSCSKLENILNYVDTHLDEVDLRY